MIPRKVVAIHQPNFFPWLGYYDKIARADVFIILDNVQFPKTGSAWVNRVRILVNGRPEWITVPVVRAYHGVRQIAEMEINNNFPWREKIIKTVQANYARAPYFKEFFPILERLLNYRTNSLCVYNIHAITSIMELIGLDPAKLVLASSLRTHGRATDLLIELTRAVDGSVYLCGGGADGYQEDEKFAQAGLDLVYQNYHQPAYPQFRSKEFVAGLSIIDVLMNCGFQRTRELIVQGIEHED